MIFVLTQCICHYLFDTCKKMMSEWNFVGKIIMQQHCNAAGYSVVICSIQLFLKGIPVCRDETYIYRKE